MVRAFLMNLKENWKIFPKCPWFTLLFQHLDVREETVTFLDLMTDVILELFKTSFLCFGSNL